MKIININKPKGWTSFEVVNFLKKKFNEKKIGHLGTLDPMATGVLPIFMGKATKLIPFFNNIDKTYRAVCKLGVSTDTYDAEGEITSTHNPINLSFENISNTLLSFLGQQNQLIPPFSSAKINGVPYYKLARKGLKTPKKIRSIVFHELKIEKIELPFIHYTTKCSKGTYIRAMVNDLGISLNVGAHLTSLDRIACGLYFNLKNSISIEKLNRLNTNQNIPWISPLILLEKFYTIFADNNNIRDSIKFGRMVKIIEFRHSVELEFVLKESKFEKSKKLIQTKVLDKNQNLIAIGRLLWENKCSFFQPYKVFI